MAGENWKPKDSLYIFCRGENPKSSQDRISRRGLLMLALLVLNWEEDVCIIGLV